MPLRITLLVFALAFGLDSSARAHGYLVDPPARTEEAGQQLPPPCADFPDPGPIQTPYTQGQSVVITLNITIDHPAGDEYHFQICPKSEIDEQCFLEGELAAFPNAGQRGIQHFEVVLPEDLTCDPCVLRWQWDAGYLSCADIAIVPEANPNALSGAALLCLLALRQRWPQRQ